MGLGLIYCVTFLGSRVFVRVEGHVAVLRWVLRRSRDRPSLLCLGVLCLAFLLSTIIPNLITVLTLLPVVAGAVEGLDADERTRRRLLTLLGLSVIYGANLGGMASLVGSPQNGLLLLVLARLETPGREVLTLGRWFLFGIPMALVLLLAGWGVLTGIARRGIDVDVRGIDVPDVRAPADLRYGLWLLVLSGVGCLAVALFEVGIWTLLGLALVWTAGLHLIRLPSGGPVLRVTDLWRGLPVRGVAFALGVGALGLALERAGLVAIARDWLLGVLPSDLGFGMAIVFVTVVTIFATELLSNTATAVAMWAVASTLALSVGHPSLLLLLGVGLGASCAFMSPIATPATGMAFGGLKGLSLKTMIVCGLAMNLLAAFWLSFSLTTWIPWVLQLPG